ncbi:hypothetical protein CTheo_2964 [Ceratobasidium theobromae]|uniref:NACHT domain-containing protein n=1 Tax=Ceratobasidium theobromae TaxID=1582974 RepID=A0A5N5QP75_9AGAM|nr:hypothetical protein CTheo_2964 [Ceratobasidium theobromae]
MASPPVSPKPKRSVRGYIREKYDKLVRSHSRSPSQQSIAEATGSGASPSSPPPNTIGNFLAPPPHTQTVQLRHARSESQLSTGPEPATDLETSSKSTTWAGLRSAFEELRKVAGPFPPLEAAIRSLIPCLGLLETEARNKKEYEEIASELKDLGESLTQHMKETNSIRMSRCIANVALGIEQQTKLIEEKGKRGIGRRFLEASADEEAVISYYRKIESLFRRLQTDVNLSTWSVANEVLANTRLEGLTPAKLANYDSKLSREISRRTCTEGTRTAIMSEMDNWSLDPNAPDLYLMSGMAGTGKTTIACSFSSRLEERKQLAASFFCTRTSPECRDASRIAPTIAYQLARYSTPFQSALCEVLGEDPDIGSKDIVKQFERLLKGPLLKVKAAIPENLVVVIDALDECDDRRSARLVLDLIFRFAPGLPLKFFTTSRPEPEIYSKMIAQSPTSRTILHLHEIETSLVQADIELYLKEELDPISPSEDEIVQLATRSGNLFIYAATLVRYIQPDEGSIDPQQRLQTALAITSGSTNKYAEIDGLYTTVLKAALQRKGIESEEAADVQAVLWTVLCVQEPISVDTLSTLSGINDTRRTVSVLQPLRSVVHLSETTGLVSTLHASFPDFMFTKERSDTLFCDRIRHNQLLAGRCFLEMKQHLRFNICDLESSFTPDAEVADLEGRIAKAISPTLSYGCRYWADHLEDSTNSSSLSADLEEFLSTWLLFWMEVLNLKHETSLGLGMLVKAKKWLERLTLPPNLIRFAVDAQSFLTSYVANPVSQFTPHIYISSLLLCPRSSSVYKHYWPRTHGLISLKGDGMDRIETASLATWNIGSIVRSATYSPDGSRVAFGCKDGMVGIRNAYDGSPIIGPFKAHDDIIWAVAFSPDGTRFLSASNDCTIKVWNAQDGTLIGEPFRGHTAGIKTAAFSPDGRLIASGSADRTVRVWDANSGTSVAEPFRGHTNWVWSVAFSPDSMRIVSGSSDHTIRVWNIQDGRLAFDPLKGHTDTVWSVALSPNGTQIVSGSADKTIRVWNAQNGTLVIGPLEGHVNEVFSVAFSPNGSRFVSSSRDKTIQVWSSENGSLVAGPLEGHTDTVWSTVFSPDGMRVVSGGGDGTIRVWNASAGIAISIFNQPKGHTEVIWSVAFAPNDTYIASGSVDSIYVWDSQHGTCLAGPFKGHTKTVRSVAVSPDSTCFISCSDDHTIRVWDSSKGTLLAGPFNDHSDVVGSVAFSPDGAYIASGSGDMTICIRNSSDGSLIAPPFKGHASTVRSIAFSPSGVLIASGSYDHTVRVWNIRDGKIITDPFLGHTNWVMSVAFSPCDQFVVSGSKDRTIRLWNTNNGTLAADPFTKHADSVTSVAFSPDGTRVVSASYDRTTLVWHPHSGEIIAGPFTGHTHHIQCAMFSFDSARIVSCSWDSTIRMWDLSGIQGTLPLYEPAHSPALVPPPSSSVRSPMPHSEWAVKDDGWIVDRDGRVLFWAPPEIIRCLLTPYCLLIISRFGTIEVDFGSAMLGERWRECYKSIA